MIDLTIDNEINPNNVTKDKIGEFVKELQNLLEKEESKTSSLNSEILNEIDLARKYKDILNSIVSKCMEDLSYEYDFIYFDYDKKENSYYFDFYSGGETIREYLSQDDAKGIESEKGTIWHIWGEDNIAESDGLKDNVKFNTEYELKLLDLKKEDNKYERKL